VAAQEAGTDPMLNRIITGAVGAVIALLVKGYFDHRRLIYKRRLKHRNSLVLLELRLMDVGAALHDNKIKFHSIVRGAKHGQILIGRPLTLMLEDSFFSDSYVLELNQKLYNFRYDLRRINSDVESFNRAYNMLSDAMILNQIQPKDFLMHLNGLLTEQDKLKEGFQELLDSSVQLLGYVQVRMEKDTTWLMRHRTKILQKGIKEVTNEEVEQKVKEHLDGILENQQTKN
jgi:hypothetical protein